MAGEINLKVEKFKPKRQDLVYYPAWVWEITGTDSYKNNIKCKICPSWQQIEKAILDTIIHELKVDTVTNRNPDTQRYMKFLENIMNKCKELQTEIKNFEIESIYKNCMKGGFDNKDEK